MQTKLRGENYLDIPVGVRFSTEYCSGAWTMLPVLDVAVIAAPGSKNYFRNGWHTGYAARVGEGWKVYGLGTDGYWGGRVKAGLNARYGERMGVGLDYTFEARKKYTDHRLSAAFTLAF